VTIFEQKLSIHQNQHQEKTRTN